MWLYCTPLSTADTPTIANTTITKSNMSIAISTIMQNVAWRKHHASALFINEENNE